MLIFSCRQDISTYIVDKNELYIRGQAGPRLILMPLRTIYTYCMSAMIIFGTDLMDLIGRGIVFAHVLNRIFDINLDYFKLQRLNCDLSRCRNSAMARLIQFPGCIFCVKNVIPENSECLNSTHIVLDLYISRSWSSVTKIVEFVTNNRILPAPQEDALVNVIGNTSGILFRCQCMACRWE